MQNPSGGVECYVTGEAGAVYVVSRLISPEIGIQILRADGYEIDNLELSESFPDIGWTEIEVNQPDLIARISEITEEPSSGNITVLLNDRVAAVATTQSMLADDVTRDLADAIDLMGFEVAIKDHFIVVTRDLWQDTGITRVGLITNDPAIKSSHLSLGPPGHGLNGPQ